MLSTIIGHNGYTLKQINVSDEERKAEIAAENI